jgi:hypothetical protein
MWVGVRPEAFVIAGVENFFKYKRIIRLIAANEELIGFGWESQLRVFVTFEREEISSIGAEYQADTSGV